MPGGKIKESRMGVEAMAARAGRLQRMTPSKPEALLGRRCALEEEFKGGGCSDCQTFDQIPEGCVLIDDIEIQIETIRHDIFEYSRNSRSRRRCERTRSMVKPRFKAWASVQPHVNLS